MPQVERIRFLGHGKGYNTRDDQFSLSENNELLVLENAIPRGQDIIPREGIRARGTTIDNIDWSYPFRHVDTPHVLAKVGVDLYAIKKNGNYYMIRAGAFPSSTVEVCAERIGDSVLIGCDATSNWPATLVSMNDGVLTASNANIFPPSTVALSVISAGTSATQADDTYTVGRMSRTFTVTFIRRTDAIGVPDGMPATTDYWWDGAAESYDEIARHYTYPGVDAEWNKLSLKVDISNVPTDCTHVRLWVTQGIPWTGDERLDENVISAGSELRWWKDISILDFADLTHTIPFILNEGTLAGETHLISTIGANEVPPCKFMKYCNGRLWVGGGAALGSPGRWYYSMPIEGDTPSRYLTMFNLSNQYVDTSIDDTERAMGIGVTKGDVIFFCEKDVWRLPSGDPDNGVVKIAEGFGTNFPNSICEYGQQVFYLSNRGPAYVSGGLVEDVQAFAAGEVWPDQADGSKGYFHSLDRARKRRVKTFWFKDSWFVMDEDMCVAFYAPIGDPRGAWKIVPAVGAEIKMLNPVVLNSDSALLLSSGKVYRFLETNRDGSGFYYTVRVQYSPRHIDRRKWYKVAEVWDMIVHANWEDNGEMRMILHSEDDLRTASHRYDQRPVTEKLQRSDVANSARRIIQQGLREGMYGTWFTMEWLKVFRGPLWCVGAEIGIIPRDGSEFDYISYSDPDPYNVQVDENLAIFDDTFQEGLNV